MPPPFGTTPAPAEAISDAPTFSGFQALGDDNTSIPPDTTGAVGLNHLMTTLNSQVRIQDRTGAILSTVSLNSFWAPTGATEPFDPRVLFDPQAGCWIASAASNQKSPGSSVLIGASQTNDPTGNWNLFRFTADTSGVSWADFPVLGFDPTWVALTVNMFTNVGDRFVNAKVFVFTKADLCAGGQLSARVFSTTPNAFTLAPATSYDLGSTTFYLAEEWNGNLTGRGLLRLSTITGAAGSETFTEGTGFVSVPATWSEFFPGDLAPQMGSTLRIDAGDTRMGNCVLRFSSLWCAHTVLLPPPPGPVSRSSVQWWQFDPATFVVQQSGRVDDASGTNFYGFPSIAVNMNQDVLIGYSRFSASQFAGSNFSFRAGADPPGTLQADTVSKDGEAPYFKTFGGRSNRWGDYSNTLVDPVDDTTLWTIQEYAWTPGGGFDRWSTWWTAVTPAPAAPMQATIGPGSSGGPRPF